MALGQCINHHEAFLEQTGLPISIHGAAAFHAHRQRHWAREEPRDVDVTVLYICYTVLNTVYRLDTVCRDRTLIELYRPVTVCI